MATIRSEVTLLGITTTGSARVDDEQYLATVKSEVTLLGITTTGSARVDDEQYLATARSEVTSPKYLMKNKASNPVQTIFHVLVAWLIN
ncbi:hypothetical protein [Enterococcus rotai]|uniref:hypothetical protein n=1 Tax=Enterococcus rotai TaxID=118060 RepID=UPI0035C6E00B